MYVAYFSDWIVGDKKCLEEMHTELSLMTVAERESLYARKEVCKALEAGEFLKVLGYPTKHEAISMVRDGNVMNLPYTVNDVRRFFDSYGAQVLGIRVKTTKRHAKMATMSDTLSKQQITNQELVMDVMHIASEKFLISASSPVEFKVVCHIALLSKSDLSTGV
jgi:hypothetical protein